MEGGDFSKKPLDTQFMSFQDFNINNHPTNSDQAQLNIGAPDHQVFRNDPSGIGMIEDLQGMPTKSEGSEPRSFWTVEYYQKFFNINTNDVLERIKRSMIPYGTDNYLTSHIRPNPDLYGPFWICVTLVFSIAISRNMADYLQYNSDGNTHWKYHFHVVSYAATCIFLYACLLPLLLWGALKWTEGSRSDTSEELIVEETSIGLLELLCLYGYSLSIYIPVAFLWTVQIGWLQWSLVVVATFLSGGVLLRSLLPVIPGKHRFLYMGLILGMHLLLATGFMLYFFHVPAKHDTPQPIPPIVTSTALPKSIPRNMTRSNASS